MSMTRRKAIFTDGMSELKELEERFGIDFEEDEFDTLNGFLISKMDRIPEENEEFSIVVGGYKFQILKVENRRIEKVLVVKQDPEADGALSGE